MAEPKTRKSPPSRKKHGAKPAIAVKAGAARVKKKAAKRQPAAAKKPAKAAGAKARKIVAAPARRAVFIDVENTSNEVDLLSVLDDLKIDRGARPTRVVAVGNWRSVGHTLARRLAEAGAELVHSAPITGVRDWSDLWIAVAAGRWLAEAKPGDALDVVSADRAFAAVGDAAANAGVIFRRIAPHAAPSGETPAKAAEAGQRRRRRRRGGRRRRGAWPAQESRVETAEAEQPESQAPAPVAIVSVPAPAAMRAERASRAAEEEEAHAASHAQIRATVEKLAEGDPSRWINLDLLANALRDAGFTRPPGSPRLITRLRRMKDLEMRPDGTVRFVAEPPADESKPLADERRPAATKPRRRGGRGRGRGRKTAAVEAAAPAPA